MSTPILPFAVWQSGTNQNSIPANDNSLRNQILNGLVIGVENSPPGGDADGDIYIVGDTPAGAFASFDEHDLVIYDSGTWYAFAPADGIVVNVAGSLKAWDGTDYVDAGGSGALALDDLSDVDAGAPTDGYALTWNDSAGKWEPTAPTSGMSNPMTTAGDMIVGGTSGAPQRLAAGTDTYVLTMVSGAPAWAAGGGGGGSPGGSDTQVQFNDAGAFAGNSAFTFDKTAKALSAPVMDFGKGTDIARAATTPIGVATGNFVHLTGTTTITSFGTGTAGQIRYIRFAGAGTLTHNATSLILPSAANITTAANDTCIAISEGGSNWRVVAYTRANGQALAAGAASVANWTTAISTVSPNNPTPVASWAATNAATNVDAAIIPKGTGAIIAAVPTNTVSGGNKRGVGAVDFQLNRGAASNVASGQYAFIGGGYSNTASGARSCVPGGSGNEASGTYSFACGISATASGVAAFSSGGTASGEYSVSMGSSSTASADFSVAIGYGVQATGHNSLATGRSSLTRGVIGARAHQSHNFSDAGDCQRAEYQLSAATSGDTPTRATVNRSAASTNNQSTLPSGRCARYTIEASAFDITNGDAVTFSGYATAKNVGGTFSIVGTPSVSIDDADSALSGCAISVAADNTNKALAVTVTGVAGRAVSWNINLRAIEVR